jgi:hypothetical protein
VLGRRAAPGVANALRGCTMTAIIVVQRGSRGEAGDDVEDVDDVGRA